MNQTSVREWYEALPLVKKKNIIDYKFTNFDWDDLNNIDHQLIELAMRRSGDTLT